MLFLAENNTLPLQLDSVTDSNIWNVLIVVYCEARLKLGSYEIN